MFFAQAEREVKRAQEEFERQIEITKLLLEGLSSAQVRVAFLNEIIFQNQILPFTILGKPCPMPERLCHPADWVLQSVLSAHA